MLSFDVQFILELLLAAVCGAALGLEREIHRKPAGLRTNMLIAVGAAMFANCGIALVTEGGNRGDVSRVAAQIVVGIGFIGAGTIMRHEDQVSGLTSAATVWVVAAIGTLAGANRPALAIGGTVIALVILHGLVRLEGFILARIVHCEARLIARDREGIVTDITALFRQNGVTVQTLDHHRRAEDGRIEISVGYYSRRARHEKIKGKLKEIEGLEKAEARIL